MFCTTFCKRVHNSKEIVNIQVLFVLTVGYLDMTIYSLATFYYIIQRMYLIYRLSVLCISIFQILLFLYVVSWRHKRDYLHASIDILFYIVFYVINTTKKRYTFLHHVCTYGAKQVPISSCSPPNPLFVTKLLQEKNFRKNQD